MSVPAPLVPQQPVAAPPVEEVPPSAPYTVVETARTLRVSPAHVRNLIKRGDIRALELGHVIRIPSSEIARILNGGEA